MAKTGPKAEVTSEPLTLRKRRVRSKSFEDFCRKYLSLKSAPGKPFKPVGFQLDIVSQIFDCGDVFLAGVQIGRKNGKTALMAAIALWDMFVAGPYGANVVCCAVNEAQAMLLFKDAAWMVENSPELAARALIYKDHIEVPGRAATLRALPAEARGLEGLLYSTAILDEAGDASLDTFETLLDAQGALDRSRLILIGTPSGRDDTPLHRVRDIVRTEARASHVFIEYSADAFRSHDWDCDHCLTLANPAVGAGFLKIKALDATKPPATSITRYRQRRLGQWIAGTGESWLDASQWDACDDGRTIEPGANVVVSIDGSRVSDSTALVMASIEEKPVIELVQLWQPHLQDDDYRVPVADVEARIRALSDIYCVREITGDPAQGWSRTFSILADEGFTVAEFPNSSQRMMPAIAAFKFAVLEGELSHNGDPQLAQHITNAVMRERERGYLIYKPASNSAKKIDATISSVMAHARARHHWRRPKAGQLRVLKMRK
ncbi:terminase TerL endonuclease subunit [uncultured Jatrophihabitans sp.]|uniref:terminase TerL endonuclease subunit n=1 Tax=uncultured Jatrophihabitans sp. TaxID=1610747 RepID=UPI0035CC6DBD